MKKKRNACADSDHDNWKHGAQQHHKRTEIDVEVGVCADLIHFLVYVLI